MNIYQSFKIDFLKALACIAVIVLHCSSGVVGGFGGIDDAIWMQGNIINSFTRWCVPVFLMVSGYLYFNQAYNKSSDIDILKKRFLRILGPFVFYGLIYIAFKYYTEPEVNILLILSEGLPYYHFWYLSMLFGLYLLFFVIQKLRVNFELNVTEVVVITMLLAMCGLSQLNLFSFINYFEGLRYLPMALFGYYLFNFKKGNKYIFLLVFVLISIMIARLTFINSELRQQVYIKYYDYLGILCIVQSSALILFVLNTEFSFPEKVKTFIVSVSKNSLGIYLIHVLFLEVFSRGLLGFTMNEFAVFGIKTQPVVAIIVTSVLVFGLSFFVISFFAKHKHISKLIN